MQEVSVPFYSGNVGMDVQVSVLQYFPHVVSKHYSHIPIYMYIGTVLMKLKVRSYRKDRRVVEI